MITDQVPGISKLTREEKFALASELWDEVFDQKSDGTESDPMRNVVSDRWEGYLKNPEEGSTWESIRSKLGKS